MLDFSPISIDDKSWFDPIIFAEDSRSADFNFGNIYMWDESFHQLAARCGDRVIVMPTYQAQNFFVCPIGSGPLQPVLEEMRAYAEAQGFPFSVCGLSAEYAAEFERLYPGKFRFTPQRAYFDYIYSAEKLSTLAGKKLHGKRNHINRFVEENTWHFERLTRDQIPACMDMLAQWTAANPGEAEVGVDDEHTAIVRGFDQYEALGLEGGVLYANGELIAFTVGELINSDTVNVHFEKARADIQGAYPMVNREFVRQLMADHPQVRYINREDDMGHENLRKAKESYYPDILFEKYTADWIG